MLSVQELSDHIEIVQVLQRYGMAIDGKNFDLFHSIFAPEARLRYVMDEQEANGSVSEWIAIFQPFLEAFYYTQHIFSHPIVSLDGDTARTTCRLHATHVQIDANDRRSSWHVFGTYQDQLVRLAAGWRIRERTFKGLHTEGEARPAHQVRSFASAPWI